MHDRSEATFSLLSLKLSNSCLAVNITVNEWNLNLKIRKLILWWGHSSFFSKHKCVLPCSVETFFLTVCLNLLWSYFETCPVLPTSDYQLDVSVNKHPIYCSDLQIQFYPFLCICFYLTAYSNNEYISIKIARYVLF